MGKTRVLWGMVLLLSACNMPADEQSRLEAPSPNLGSGFRSVLRTYSPGLGQFVELGFATGEGLQPKLAQLANGRIVPYSGYVATERDVYRARFGSATQEVVAAAQEADPDAYIRVAVTFDRNELPSPSAEPVHFIEQFGSLVGEIEEATGVTLEPSARIPMAFGDVAASQVVDFSRHPAIRHVSLNYGGEPEARQSPPGTPSPLVANRMYDAFNKWGFFGSGYRIGILERTALYGINSAHDWFSRRDVFYEASPTPCSMNPSICNALLDPGMCNTALDFCVSFHPQAVASSTGFFDPNQNDLAVGAVEADLYFSNAPFPSNGTTTVCDADAVDQSFSYFLDKDVRFINESYGCTFGSGSGFVQDAYIYHHDLVLARAGANSTAVASCPHTLNSICVQKADLSFQGDVLGIAGQAFANYQGSDREEPDIVLGGAWGNYPDLTDAFDWIGADPVAGGTVTAAGASFASPQLAAAGVLCAEMMKSTTGRTLSGLAFRSYVAASGHMVNPEGPRYSTPGWDYGSPSPDFTDGAGFSRFDQLARFCSSPSNVMTEDGVISSGETLLDLNAGDAVPSTEGFQYPEPKDFSNGDKPDITAGRVLGEFEVSSNGRLRFSMHWNACPTSGPGPTAVSSDLDLGLYDVANERWVFLSQSFDDNNEGFDYEFEAETKVVVFALWDPSIASTSCEGNGEARISWASVFWK